MSPVAGSFHTLYWENSNTNVVSVVQGGYPTWQSAPLSQVLGSGFGGMTPMIERIGMRLRWAWRLFWLAIRLSDEQRDILWTTAETVRHPLYQHARRAVRMTAVKPGMNGPVAWKSLASKLHQKHVWAENTWRHLAACDDFEAMIRAEGSTVSNQCRTLLVELAYRGFAKDAVGSTGVTR